MLRHNVTKMDLRTTHKLAIQQYELKAGNDESPTNLLQLPLKNIAVR